MKLLITIKEAEEMLSSKENKINISLDLGISKTEVKIENETAFMKGNEIKFSDLKKIKDGWIYFVENNKLEKFQFFSKEKNLYYKLVPTADWPTIKISSVPMHRYTKISPKEDTMLKIKEISPVFGNVLDTCCGLGYSAIIAAEKAEKVFTFERDGNILEICKLNPYSQRLFSEKNIKIEIRDVSEKIKNFEDNYFNVVIHDPPTFKLSPELYSEKFYKEIYRVLKEKGKLYHSAPSPGKNEGNEFYLNIIKKLKNSGFKNVIYKEKSSGVVASK
ncbi:methyltransferase domain-containing protein [Candidatus Woesearchaeota archaeon]|nr:methyltransferase domain-containing protein [Candidatus Woesearchaeota archaeon]